MEKIDKRRHYITVLDIETANTVNEGLAYDIGFVIADTKGNIYKEFSFMTSEMFCDNKDLMETAYYAEKLPQYWKEYYEGKRIIASIYTIRKILCDCIKQYNAYDVYAYNCAFDKSGCNRTFRYLTKSKFRFFFPYGCKFHCIWHIACQTIFQQKTFAKMALLNEWFSDSGNVRTSAEIANRYITGNADFEEAHTGLEDVKIELEILIKCLRQHKKIDSGINRLCWRLPQKKVKSFLENS